MEKVLMQKILIVEDDQAVKKELQQLFESAGYAVEISIDGKSALEIVRTSAPDSG
jgi:CheY-like chemotaxis protein